MRKIAACVFLLAAASCASRSAWYFTPGSDEEAAAVGGTIDRYVPTTGAVKAVVPVAASIEAGGVPVNASAGAAQEAIRPDPIVIDVDGETYRGVVRGSGRGPVGSSGLQGSWVLADVSTGKVFKRRLWAYCFHYAPGNGAGASRETGIILAGFDTSPIDLLRGLADSFEPRRMRIALLGGPAGD